MTLNIKIADKMCSKGKIKFCVKELKLEKRRPISFGDFINILIHCQGFWQTNIDMILTHFDYIISFTGHLKSF